MIGRVYIWPGSGEMVGLSPRGVPVMANGEGTGEMTEVRMLRSHPVGAADDEREGS